MLYGGVDAVLGSWRLLVREGGGGPGGRVSTCDWGPGRFGGCFMVDCIFWAAGQIPGCDWGWGFSFKIPPWAGKMETIIKNSINTTSAGTVHQF